MIKLHTFGERLGDGCVPQLPESRKPLVPTDGRINDSEEGYPESIEHDADSHRLLLKTDTGKPAGAITNVTAKMWAYSVYRDTPLLKQWFSYRNKSRSRPDYGRERSPLNNIRPKTWPSDYTTELLNVLNVIGLLIDLEPQQSAVLDRILEADLLTYDDLRAEGALDIKQSVKADDFAGTMFED